MINKRFLQLFIFSITCIFSASSQNEILLSKKFTGLSKPVYITHANDERLFIVEQAGKIKVVINGMIQATPFLNITDRVNARSNEQGLLGLAFDPDFKNNHFIYVNYISNGVNRTIVSRFNLVPGKLNLVDSLSEKVLLTINQPATNHNGGCINFGKDGFLYIGQGDGGGANDQYGNGKNKKSLLSKMLRIDVNVINGYKIPPTNPFINDTSYLPEIWAMGLRNPWRWSFDRLTGDMWIGDVGQNIWEEVDLQDANSKGGENYGWSCYEGNHTFNSTGCGPLNNYVAPVMEYQHSNASCGGSITGGYVYRGFECSKLYGNYIYADYCSGKIWAANVLNKDSIVPRLVYSFPASQISSFGEDVNGELYLCAITEGAIYTISDSCKFSFNFNTKPVSCIGNVDGQLEIKNQDCKYVYSLDNKPFVKSIDSLGSGIHILNASYSFCKITDTILIDSTIPDSICITPLFVSEICEGDSALIIACDANVATYEWSKDNVLRPELSGKRIFVKETGSYSVVSVSSMGCKSYPSSSVKLTVHPMPTRPSINRIGDSLYTTPNYNSYVWYYNGNLLSSSTSPFIIVNKLGDYQVEVIDSNQCRSLKSDTIQILQTSVQNFNKSMIKLIPNPTNETFSLFIEGELNQDCLFTIYSLEGKKLMQKPILKNERELFIDIHQFDDGVYLYKLLSKTTYTKIQTGLIVKKN